MHDPHKNEKMSHFCEIYSHTGNPRKETVPVVKGSSFVSNAFINCVATSCRLIVDDRELASGISKFCNDSSHSESSTSLCSKFDRLCSSRQRCIKFSTDDVSVGIMVAGGFFVRFEFRGGLGRWMGSTKI